MNHLLFSANMKMADLVQVDYKLLTVLSRFGIPLGFGDKSVKEVCSQYGLAPSFFMLVCNVHTFHDYLPGKEDIRELDIDSLINYLQSSHRYYRERKIGTIEKQLTEMVSPCQDAHRKVILRFFNDYKKEVFSHFSYEEEVVFPYIRALVGGEDVAGYSIDQFGKNHTNIEEKLGDLKNIIIKYLPENCLVKQQNYVLFEIFLFEEDLNSHTLMEDKILIPFVKEIEKSHGSNK